MFARYVERRISLPENRVPECNGQSELTIGKVSDEPFGATAMEFDHAAMNARSTARGDSNTANQEPDGGVW